MVEPEIPGVDDSRVALRDEATNQEEDDMSTPARGASRSKLEAYADNLIEKQLEELDAQIQDLNDKLAVYDRVKERRDQLLAARRALLGVGNKLTGEGGKRITQDEVAQWMARNAGSHTVADIAAGLSTNDAVIRGHLSRGKDSRFTKNGDGKWRLRDPESGDA